MKFFEKIIKEKRKVNQKEGMDEFLPKERYLEDKKAFALKNDLKRYMSKKECYEVKDNLLIRDGLPVDGIARGNEEIGNKNFKIAEIYFKQELFRNPEQTNAWVGLAHAYAGLEQFKEALNSIRTAIRLDQRDPYFNKLGQISVIQAEVLMELGRFNDARDVLEKEVLELNPDFGKAKALLEKCDVRIST